jgi:hypothetical protein
VTNQLKIGYRLESWHHAFAQHAMLAIRSILNSDQFATKEEHAEMAKESLGTNPANCPFYWKQQDNGKKLVCNDGTLGLQN